MNKPFPVQVGDYCRAYHKGIHRVVGIEYPTTRASWALVTLESVLDSAYRPRRARNTCDMAYCTKVDKKELLRELDNKYAEWSHNVNLYLKD